MKILQLWISKITAVFFLLLVFTLPAFTQQFRVEIDVNYFPDTIFQNQNVQFEIELDNKDTLPFAADVFFHYMITDSIPASIPGDLIPSFTDTINVSTILPDSSFETTKNLFIDPIYFDGNEPNIIIIWPTVNSVAIKFTMHLQQIWVNYPVGINELIKQENLILYPNPVSENLNIKLEKPLLTTGIIDIYSSTGLNVKTIYLDKNLTAFSLDMKDNKKFPAGKYYLVIEANGIRENYKLMVIR